MEMSAEKQDVGAALVRQTGSGLHSVDTRMLLDLKTFPRGSKFLSTVSLTVSELGGGPMAL